MTSNFERLLTKRHEDPNLREARENVLVARQVVRKLVAHRKALKLSQATVADRMGVKQPMVSGFENEGSDPYLSTILRYARAVEAEVIPVVRTPETSAWRRPAAYVQRSGAIPPQELCEVVSLASARRARAWKEATAAV